MIWFASITINLGPTFLSGALAANTESGHNAPSCPLVHGPFRHYILNVLWIAINMICVALTLIHLRKLHKDLTKANVEAVRIIIIILTGWWQALFPFPSRFVSRIACIKLHAATTPFRPIYKERGDESIVVVVVVVVLLFEGWFVDSIRVNWYFFFFFFWLYHQAWRRTNSVFTSSHHYGNRCMLDHIIFRIQERNPRQRRTFSSKHFFPRNEVFWYREKNVFLSFFSSSFSFSIIYYY